MTISAIITRGYGTFAGRKYVPTRGYVSGNAPIVVLDTHDGFVKRKASLKKRYDALEKREFEKLSQLKSLRDDLRRVEKKAEKANVAVDPKVIADKQIILADKTKEIQLQIDLIASDILRLSRERGIEARRLREEDDIQALLLLL